METVIIILLLIAIGMLLHMVMAQGKRECRNRAPQERFTKLPDIIGNPKSHACHPGPIVANGIKNEIPAVTSPNFDTATEAIPSAIPQEEPGKTDGVINWKEEEEEMEYYTAFRTDEGLATGVTFDELVTVGRLLGRKALEPPEKSLAVSMISKIDGTGLLSLLESRVEDVSKKIAMLLDGESA